MSFSLGSFMSFVAKRFAFSPGFVERANRAMIDGRVVVVAKQVDRPAVVSSIIRSARLSETEIRANFSEALKTAESI